MGLDEGVSQAWDVARQLALRRATGSPRARVSHVETRNVPDGITEFVLNHKHACPQRRLAVENAQ